MITKKFVLDQLIGEPRTNALGEVRINCPECEDTKGHMYCNLKKNLYYCHKCGAKGRIVEGITSDLSKFYKVLRRGKDTIFPQFDFAKAALHTADKIVEKEKKVKNLPNCTPIIVHDNGIDVSLLSDPYGYLKRRGLTRDDLRKYDIRYCVDQSGIFKDTIIFPIWVNKQKNILKYYVCRRLTNADPRYVNAPWNKEDSLFNASPNQCDGKFVVITEGIFDAIAVCKAGFHAVSILGKKATVEQLHRICNEDRWAVIILLDRDAFTHAVKLKLELDNYNLSTRNSGQILEITTSICVINEDKDPADYMAENKIPELRKLIDDHIQSYY